MQPSPPMPSLPDRPADLETVLSVEGYLADPGVALALWLALQLGRPLLLEGPAGVGKTELARASAAALQRPLLRLQCYEGLDEAKALYEWDYGKQMLFTQLLRDVVSRQIAPEATFEEAVEVVAQSASTFFSERFLLPRPLLQALRSERPAVLLIDEVDRADPEFEAFLLELLSEMQVTLPELGTLRAKHPPLVLLTTNGTREMTEALRRRCLHVFVDYPPPSREMAILKRSVPGLEEGLSAQIVAFVAELRKLDLRKVPALSETIDWARSLVLLGRPALGAELTRETLGLLLKHQSDKADVEAKLPQLLRAVGTSATRP